MIYTLTLNPSIDHSLSVPELQANEVLRAQHSQRVAGGKGVNVARMLKRLDCPHQAIVLVAGKTGDEFKQRLNHEGVQAQWLACSGETRVNVCLQQNDGTYFKVNEPGPKVTASEQAQLLRLIKQQVKAGDWWVLSGSLAQGLANDFYAQIVELIQAAGAFAVVDASGAALSLAAKAKPALMKPNWPELCEWLALPIDRPFNAEHIAQQLAAYELPLVVVSHGEHGAWWFSTENSTFGHVPACSVQVQNPTGAGDALLAGLVAKLASGADIETALKFAVVCGSATASQPGSELANKAQIDRLIDLFE